KIKIEKREHAGMYKELYAVFAGIYGEKELLKSKEVDLYRRIYIALGKFYKKVQVADENEYILIGKNIIVNQKYVKCEKTVNLDIAQEISNESVASPEYMLKMNKWGVSLNVHQHYHVHYVDNTAARSRMLCMPIHEDSEGNKLYLHTIDGIVEHIKILYGIYKDSDSVHPFRVEKGTKLWSYIKKKDRHLTMKDLSEYNIVFYHIEEDFDKAEFTFAEFWPKTPWGDGVICIPLFLTPLMRSAVALGPFVQKKDHKVVDLEEFEDKKPSVYMYNKKYNENNYSDVHKYYRNLYIRQEKEKENIDCYTMDCRTAKEENRAIKAVWYVRMPDSVDEYTHCIPDESFKGKENTEKFNNFVNALESREYNKDSDLQGIWLSNNSNGEDIEQEKKTKSICNWLVEINNKKKKTTKSQEQIKSQISVYEQRLKMKQEEVEEIKKSNKNKHRNQADYTKVKKTTITMISKYRKNLEILYKELSSQPSTQAELIVFRNMNSSKSNLGAHNEMFDVLISRYKYRTQAEVNWQ
ncbi:hypothetical protein NEMIN01_1532, partial [Nematocida minor]|uniref:uncharacterized protein n=1 Tax=Nematocida minor TaxID=1912983 RepID=UPI002220F848